jgi:hypothetical protein
MRIGYRLWLWQASQPQLEIDWGDYRLGLAIALLVLVGIVASIVLLYLREK